MTAIEVRFPAAAPTGYTIAIEPGLFARLGQRVAALFAVGGLPAPASAVVISDENVAALYGRAAVESLSSGGFKAELLSFPAGEEHKDLGTAGRLWDGLARLAVERATPIIALGGGVTGDVAGFVAACYLRGLPVVQAPTTLLACVDSAVGGKTGVNHPRAGKNMIGAFHQPAGVLIDPLLLGTLDRRQWACGLAESVKHGVIRDATFFGWIEQRADRLADLAADAKAHIEAMAGELVELIAWNCRIKAAVVMADEREAGLRAILNFGHTVGHAVETLAGYGRLPHGEAVSIGMAVASRIAWARGLAGEEFVGRLTGLLARLNLPVNVPADLSNAEIIELLAKDKKVRRGRVRFVLPAGLGEATIVDDVAEAEVGQALDKCRGA